jgi:hypothetical protein
MPGADLDDRLERLLRAVQDGVTAGDPAAVVHRGRRRRLARRTAGVGAVAVLLAGVVVVAALPPEDREPVAPAGGVARVPDEGFELRVPAGWRLERELTGTVRGGPTGVVGVVLTPASAEPREATITVTAAGGNELWGAASSNGSKRRADGRRYLLRPGSGPREVGQYLVQWADFCPSGRRSCRRMSASPRVLLVTGVGAPGDAAGRQQVLRAMLRVVAAMKPIADGRRPPPFPTVPPRTKVLLGKGGSGTTAWEAWIEPLRGTAGFGIHFPWQEQREPTKGCTGSRWSRSPSSGTPSTR